MTASAQGKAANSIFANGGKMGELVRSLDWSQTPIGSVQSWSPSLKSLVKTLLTSRYPMVLTWRSEFTQFYNDAYSQLIGDKHPAALGTDIRETLAEAWDTLGPMIQQVMATGIANWTPALPLVLERAGYREESYFSVSHAPAEDDDGQIVGMLAVCSEVTQQVLGERRLRLLRDLAIQTGETRSVQDTCQDLMRAIAAHPLDVPFALLYLRESDSKTLTLQGTVGLTANEQLCPHSITSATHHSFWSFAPVAAGETILVEELDHHITVPGGLWKEPVHTALMMPIASSGQTAPLGVLIAGVNPNRALDEGYRSFYELLVGQVSVSIRNAQAYEEERHRAEMLAELDRAKTAFFSNVSHEFRTPLTLMLNPLEEVLQSHQLPPAEREQIAIAQRNAQRLLKLVNTLLDFSRIEAGRAQSHFELTDLATYTVELASLFQSAIEQAGLRLFVDCPPLPQLVPVDRGMWEKIVLNLLSNAFKFTFKGEIAVSLHAVDNQVELIVRDTGTGIPTADLPRLFERFHRVAGAQGRTFEGTGIGLSLVQELVHLHGGTIAVESALGYGSTFRVQLPMSSPAVSVQGVGTASLLKNHHLNNQAQPTENAAFYVQEASSWLPEIPLSPSTPPPAPARIFLVDDNADMRNYLHRILSEFYQVEVFSEGASALIAAHAATPDLILSDVMMPGMDGFELLRQLRHDPRTREVPILLLSARAGEEAAVEGLNAGANDYLVKPFSTRELLARVAVNVALGRSRQVAARRRLDQVLSSVSDFIFTFDLAGQFTYANQPLLDLWQKPFADIVGKNFFDLNYPPELADRLQQHIQQVITSRQPIKDEIPYTSHLGSSVYEYIFVPLLDANGAVEAVAGTGRNVSDRKHVEETLRQSEERYRTLFESIDEGFCVVEMLFDKNDIPIDYRFLEINPVFEQQTGLQQAVGKTARQLVPGLEDFWVETYGKVALTGKPVRFENGSAPMNRWFDVYACRTGRPEERKVAIVFKDIRERKQAEQERDRFLAVGSDLQVITSNNGYFRWVSPTFERFLGWTTAEMTSRPWTEFVHPDDVPCSETETVSLFSGNETFEFENRYRHKDGSYRWLLWNAQAYPEEQIIYGAAVNITERKQAEIALRASEERFRMLTATMPQLIWTATPDGSVDYLSQQWADYIGLPPEQLYDWRWQDVVHPEDLPNTLRDWGRSLETGEPVDIKHRFRFRTGEWRWQLVRGTPIKDEAGQVTKWVGTCTDIQSEIDAQAALHQSEARLRTVAANLPNGAVFIVDRELRYQLAEGKALEDAGITSQDLVGKTIWEALNPSLAAVYEPYFRQTLNGKPFSWEHHSHDRYYISHGTPLCSKEGEVETVLVVSYDITDRKQAEALIQATNERLKLLSEMTNELLLNEDLQSFLNTSFQKLSAHLDLEIYVNYLLQEDGQRLRLVAHRGIPTEVASAAEFLDLGQAVCGYVVQHQAAAVIENALESSSFLAAPLKHIGISAFASYPLMVNNQAIGTLGFGTRTRDRFSPEELELMQTVCDQVSTALQRSQLIKALQQRAEELAQANRIKDEFLAVLSHELRSPLNPILGWTKLLRNGKLDATRTAHALETIERNTQLQVQLIDDLLDISRILRGKLALTIAPIDLQFVISAALETVRLAAEAKSQQIETIILPIMGTVNGDAGRLQQVIWNLLSNAVKFTPVGGHITIELSSGEATARIQVKDTGKGIKPEFLPYIFEHFRQEDGATTRKFGGLGLGLAIAKQITEMHGGTIRVESQGEGMGATFVVELPLSQRTESQGLKTENWQLSTQHSALSTPLSGLHILLVDDEPDTREFQAFVLKQGGAKVTAVASGFEALQALDHFTPDVLVSDIGMAEMDGYTLMQQIRSHLPKQDNPFPAIALTAYARDMDQQQAIAAGFQRHLTKPIEPEALISAIAQLLTQNRAN